jgi:SAM-dependent methyltransferase
MNLQDSYDRVAQEYTKRIYDELAHKPFDRKMLDWLIERVNNNGAICDMGCGPGQIARYLFDHGAQACGIDLSVGMVQQARELNPAIDFQQGDMLSLTNVPGEAYGGIAAFYCILHIPRPQVTDALRELKRVLRPDGTLLLTFHIGSETRHLDDWWGELVNLDFMFFEIAEMKAHILDAGMLLEEVIQRDPYPDIEAQTQRAYIFARKPS